VAGVCPANPIQLQRKFLQAVKRGAADARPPHDTGLPRRGARRRAWGMNPRRSCGHTGRPEQPFDATALRRPSPCRACRRRRRYSDSRKGRSARAPVRPSVVSTMLTRRVAEARPPGRVASRGSRSARTSGALPKLKLVTSRRFTPFLPDGLSRTRSSRLVILGVGAHGLQQLAQLGHVGGDGQLPALVSRRDLIHLARQLGNSENGQVLPGRLFVTHAKEVSELSRQRCKVGQHGVGPEAEM
jgi:hypothetical protein